MAGYDMKVRQHKNMALGHGIRGGDSCDCEPLSSANRGIASPNAGMTHAPLDDSNRAGPPHVSRGGGKLPATAHSDHGPHHIPG